MIRRRHRFDSAILKVANERVPVETADAVDHHVNPGKYCAYNQTRERFIGSQIDAEDISIANLDTRLPALEQRSGEGLWLVPFRGISATSVRIPVDLVYLDQDCAVLDTVESFPIFSVSASSLAPASVLVLPADTIRTTGTHPGDRLILCAPAEMKQRLQRLASPDVEDAPVAETEKAAVPTVEESVHSGAGRLLHWEDHSKLKNPGAESPAADGAQAKILEEEPTQQKIAEELPQQKIADHGTAQEKVPEVARAKTLEEEPTQQKIAEELPQQKIADQGTAQEKVPDVAQAKILEEEPAQQKIAEELPQQKIADQGTAQEKVPDVAQAKILEEEPAQQKTAEELPQQKIADKGTAQEKVPEVARTSETVHEGNRVLEVASVELKPSAPEPPKAAAHESEEKSAKPARSWLQRWLNPEPTQPRKAQRESVSGLTAYFFTGGAPVAHAVRDISTSGMYVFTHERWYPGTVVRMTLTDRQQPTAEHSITVNMAVMRFGDDGVGLQFVTRPDPSRRGRQAAPRDMLAGAADEFQIAQFLQRFRRKEGSGSAI